MNASHPYSSGRWREWQVKGAELGQAGTQVQSKSKCERCRLTLRWTTSQCQMKSIPGYFGKHGRRLLGLWRFVHHLQSRASCQKTGGQSRVPPYSRRHIPGNCSCENGASLIGTVLNEILGGSIYNYLKRQELIRGSKHSFVHGKSCLLNRIYYQVTTKIDEGKVVEMVCVDFGKAFDKYVGPRKGIQSVLAKLAW